MHSDAVAEAVIKKRPPFGHVGHLCFAYVVHKIVKLNEETKSLINELFLN